MPQREAIRDQSGKILGWIDHEANGNKLLRDFSGKILGKYNKSIDVTQDFYGRQIAKGDCLMILLR